MEKDIKDYREKELRAYVIGNLLIILIGTGLLNRMITKVSVSWDVVTDLLTSALFSAIIYIFVFVLDSVIPADLKNSFIWMIYGRPGERIFTDIRSGKIIDARFSKEEALKKYAEIYDQIEAEHNEKQKKIFQNACWYKLYKRWEKEAAVFISQRDFLLCRDMCILTIWIIAGFLLFEWYLGQIVSWKIIVILVIELIATFIAAHNKSRRFAYNVIATDIAKTKTE